MPVNTSTPNIGLVFLPTNATQAVDLIIRAEEAGVAMVWLEMNAIGLDPLPLLAAAATQTERIGLGTAIVPAFSRHPAALAMQALSVEGVAPGRLRLGIGVGNAARMAEAFHHPSDRPLARLREYVHVLRAILHNGKVSFVGEFYAADVSVPDPPGTPVLLSALGPHAYALAGEKADGALSWLCPIDYLVDVAARAMAGSATAAGRPRPPLIAHVPVGIANDENSAGLREAVREDISRYARVPVFGRMLAAAGHPTTNGTVTDDLLDELVVIGDDDTVANRLTGLLDRPLDELMVSLSPETHGHNEEEALLRILGTITEGGADGHDNWSP